jgi:hypothetical protein
MWAPAIGGIAGGVLPTPVAKDDGKSPEAHLAMKARMKGGPRYTITSLAVLARNGMEQPTALPTPKAGDGERGRDKARARPDTKGRELVVAREMLPTPRAGETADRTSTPGNRFSLSAWASRGCSTLPTPTTNHSKNASLPPSQQDRDGLAGAMLRDDSIPTGAATYLNPSFVEEMMGFPIGWTA